MTDPTAEEAHAASVAALRAEMVANGAIDDSIAAEMTPPPEKPPVSRMMRWCGNPDPHGPHVWEPHFCAGAVESLMTPPSENTPPEQAPPTEDPSIVPHHDEVYRRAFIDFFGDSRLRPERHWDDPDVKDTYIKRATREIALAKQRCPSFFDK